MENIVLKPVESLQDIDAFGNFKVDLVKYHQQFAENIGIRDMSVARYTFNKATKWLGKPGSFQFIIMLGDKQIGILEYLIRESEIDEKDIIYLRSLYIIEEYRGRGYGTALINYVKSLGYRVEVECWYGMPANNLYKRLGAKEIKTRYIL